MDNDEMRKTPLAKIGRKRKSRGKSEKFTFNTIWKVRPHICSVCRQYIPEPLAHCFAHVIAKSRGERFRCNPNNIILVCSIKCHEEVDRVSRKKDLRIETLLEQDTEITYDLLCHLD